MRKPIRENPVTTMFMAGFGIFLMAGYLLIVQPERAEREKEIRNSCGEVVSLAADQPEESSETTK